MLTVEERAGMAVAAAGLPMIANLAKCRSVNPLSTVSASCNFHRQCRQNPTAQAEFLPRLGFACNLGFEFLNPSTRLSSGLSSEKSSFAGEKCPDRRWNGKSSFRWSTEKKTKGEMVKKEKFETLDSDFGSQIINYSDFNI
jgi:hypothetical protein